MARFRYWKLNSDDLSKLKYDEKKLLNWEIKCTFQPDVDAKFFGVFLYRYGTPHDYEKKKGIVYYHNNIDRNELPKFSKFLKNRYGGSEVEKAERIFLENSTEIYSPADIAKLSDEIESEFGTNNIISMELDDTTPEQLQEWGFPAAKLLPIPGKSTWKE